MLTGYGMRFYYFPNFDGLHQSRSYFLIFVNSYHKNQKMRLTDQSLLGIYNIR